MTKILAAAAHGELHVGPYAQRLSSTATTYANECRFGHTFRGSFGFTVESPVGPNTLTVGEISPAPPLERAGHPATRARLADRRGRHRPRGPVPRS